MSSARHLLAALAGSSLLLTGALAQGDSSSTRHDRPLAETPIPAARRCDRSSARDGADPSQVTVIEPPAPLTLRSARTLVARAIGLATGSGLLAWEMVTPVQCHDAASIF